MSLCVSSVMTRSWIALARDARSCGLCPSSWADKPDAAAAAISALSAVRDMRAIIPPSPGDDPGRDHDLLAFKDSGAERARRERFQQLGILPFADAFEQPVDGQHVIVACGQATHRERAVGR